METSSVVKELRLAAFKSFHDVVFPLHPLTLIVGRNGSGKSNALDGLEALSQLASGEDIGKALPDPATLSTEGWSVGIRGGARGCAPFGEREFALGCTVEQDGELFGLDVRVRVEPDPQVVAEMLWYQSPGERKLLYTSAKPPEGLADVQARYYNGKQGMDPPLAFRSTRLLTAQIASRVPESASTRREREALALVHRGATAVLSALNAVFVLDPVPHLMRNYVSRGDRLLRRNGGNLSAAVGRLKDQEDAWSRLLEMIRGLSEQRVENVLVEESQLGDVMLALEERTNGRTDVVSARLMSDGMLRFLAIAAALLEDPPPSPSEGVGRRVLVVEEIENGLHPSQAYRTVELVQREVAPRGMRLVATTHNPALLSALSGDDHEGVLVCDRDPRSGKSRLRRLIDLDGYPRALARGSLGDAVTEGTLFDEIDATERREALDRFLGKI